MSITKRLSIRFNKKEAESFNELCRKYKESSKSGFAKKLIFTEIKPYLNTKEKELIIACIIELNAIGKNLNQLLRYKAYDDVEAIIENIKEAVANAKEAL